MQKVTLLCVGKLKEKFYTEASAEYVKRLGRHCKIEIVELPEFRLPEAPSDGDVQRALTQEAASIREKLPKGGAVIAMCIEGKQMPSEKLAAEISGCAFQGFNNIVFIIGGSHGLSDSVKKRADFRLSMSEMTFPHQLARVMLLEQIYRAYQISNGGKYHK